MFCKTNRNQVLPENLDEFAKLMKEKWAPLISRQEGFERAYVMTKPSGEIVAVMLWENEAQLNAWNDNAEHKKLSGQMMPLLIGSAIVDVWEVQHTLAR